MNEQIPQPPQLDANPLHPHLETFIHLVLTTLAPVVAEVISAVLLNVLLGTTVAPKPPTPPSS